MRYALTAFLMLSGAVFAQQTVAPTNEPVGRTRGEDYHGYNIVQSFETGVRFSSIDGNLGKYRSDVNYLNGLRLLGGTFTVHSKQGKGRFFDEIVISTQGLGNDPYQSSTLRVQKNRLYRYDMTWRLNDYFNPALPVSGGLHLMNTERRLQDHDLILNPQGRYQLKAGYSRVTQDGPALSTVNLEGTRGDDFPLFSDVRRLRSEFRLGGDVDLFGVKLSLLRSWETFREDTRRFRNTSDPGYNPNDRLVLDNYRQDEPYHGSTPLWRGNLRFEKPVLAINARATYSGGQRNFLYDEFAAGVSRIGFNRQTLVFGNARRPVTTGDFNVTLFPRTRITLVNHTAVHSTRIDGDSFYRQLDSGTLSDELIYFRYLGIRTVSNSTDVNVQAAKTVSFFGGYRWSNRRFRSVDGFAFPGSTPARAANEQENTLHSGAAGVRWRPVKPLTVVLDGEVARADRPFTPISERNLHALGTRVQYKQKSLLLSAAYKQNYNVNSANLSFHSSRSRNYFFDASWAPRDWFAFDTSYAKIHLDTLTGLAFFISNQLVGGQQSLYLSNIHTANLGLRFAARKRADLYIGYSISEDAGDGRASASAPAGVSAALALLYPAQTFPLRFQSPLARVSFRLHTKLRWNAGWQLYKYNERFKLTAIPQDYRAHTGYTSVTWSF
ncbi:MAG: hypothetical protein ACKV22_08200 [Bryobacteraceae bacterium]